MNKIFLNHRQFVETLSVLDTFRRASLLSSEADPQQVKFYNDLQANMYARLESDADGCTVELDQRSCFAIWMCLEDYVTFVTAEVDDEEELAFAIDLRKRFGGGGMQA